MHNTAKRRGIQMVLVTASVALLAGCSAGANSSQSDAAQGYYPITIDNCGEEVVFNETPKRVMLLESAPVTGLAGIGVLDDVISKAGSFPDGYYAPELAQKVDAIPVLSDKIDASGHLMLSQEVVISQEPDLVFGLPNGITRAGLKDAGANVLVQNLYCHDKAQRASFDTLYDELALYGKVFNKNDEAKQLVDSLKKRVEAAEEKTKEQPKRRAAVLYPSVGGGPLYAYGAGSMANPQLEAAGFENVFEDVPDRVFEVGTEDLISRDPEVLILLYQGEKGQIEQEVLGLPGVDTVSAVKNGQVMTQLFNFTEPASPLTIDGLERIVDHFYDDQEQSGAA